MPSFFGDEQPRACTLIDIEPFGLWLAGEDLAKRVHLADTRPVWLTTVTAFFPFSQIAYVLVNTQFASLAQSAAAADDRKDSPREGTREKPSGERHGHKSENKPPHKGSQTKR